MKRTLPDVNVLLALLSPTHSFRLQSTRWFEDALRSSGEILIPYEVAVACVRLAANPHVSAFPSPPIQIHAAIGWLFSLPGLRFLAPGESSWNVFGEQLIGLQGYRTVPDAHLAGLAIANDCRLVTLDRDFLRFKGLDVELLPT